ncbi:DUF3052 family protein [Nesterenkonia alkaliphila]|uniref:DUF3052 family protein n=1 Tax=Nesterenkonia alkaliphila TaxID=1463631 RepID=A0A7K1ULY2_9MICC|nr:DUF3052 family protein [Nesterenkonia alkaliphila]
MLCRTSRSPPNPRNVSCVGQNSHAATNVVDKSSLLEELCLSADALVQEIGADSDVDDALRDALDDLLDEPLIDEDEQEVVDAVLLWFRAGEDDLTDALLDALTTLEEGGMVWLMTPRSGREGYVPPVEIQDAATDAGLHVTSSAGVSAEWAATRLVHRKSWS